MHKYNTKGTDRKEDILYGSFLSRSSGRSRTEHCKIGRKIIEESLNASSNSFVRKNSHVFIIDVKLLFFFPFGVCLVLDRKVNSNGQFSCLLHEIYL